MTFMFRKLIQPAFEQALRRVYAEPLNEPVPEDMRELLDALK